MDGQTNRKILGAKRANGCGTHLMATATRQQLDNAKFRRQHPFDDYILDFACLERMIVIELDGGQHADAVDYDAKRTGKLEKAGFIVLRFWNNEIFENMDGVLVMIWAALKARSNPSPPNPPLEGEG